MWISKNASNHAAHVLIFTLAFCGTLYALYALSYAGWTDRAANVATTTATQASSTPEVENKPVAKPAPAALKTITPWKKTMTTLFWVGEAADADNAYITNTESYWDEQWEAHYGGVDSPECRTKYAPCGFTPHENPFYFALPFAEYNADGQVKPEVARIPWYGKDELPTLKNRWIAVRRGAKTCFAQWEDVGPNGEDDFSYVFGNGKPKNTFGERAGLDASPALWTCLGMADNGETEWAFVDASEVPEGPWKRTITASGISWSN